MKFIHAYILLGCCVAVSSGCGTIAARFTPAEARQGMPVYPATRLDVGTVLTGGGFYAHGDCNNGMGPVFGWLVAVPLGIVDMPISMATDTICLPLDIVRRHRERLGWDLQTEEIRKRIENSTGDSRVQYMDMNYQKSLTLEDRRRIRDEYIKKQNASNNPAHATDKPAPGR